MIKNKENFKINKMLKDKIEKKSIKNSIKTQLWMIKLKNKQG
jgi:hypothetical protein